jgi:glutathione S-transferase
MSMANCTLLAVLWPLLLMTSLLKKPEEKRQALLELIPEAPRRERQTRRITFGLDALDVAEGVKTNMKTIQEIENAVEMNPWVVGDTFSLADVACASSFRPGLNLDGPRCLSRRLRVLLAGLRAVMNGSLTQTA